MATAPLDRERIVEAGRALVAGQGIEALGVRAVAAALEVTPMALYRYVSDADDLRATVIEACVAELPPVKRGRDPVARYRIWAVETHARLRSYPGLGRYLLLHWFEIPLTLVTVDALLEVAADMGFDGFDRVGVANAVFSFVLARVDLEEALGSGKALEREVAVERVEHPLPYLGAQLAQFRRARVDKHFLYGLELLLDGIAARVAS